MWDVLHQSVQNSKMPPSQSEGSNLSSAVDKKPCISESLRPRQLKFVARADKFFSSKSAVNLR